MVKEAVVLIGHGSAAMDIPRPLVSELKKLEGERQARREMAMSPREAELDHQVRHWPRTAQNDPYREGVRQIADRLAPRLPGKTLVIAFNEFCAPSVEEAVAGLVASGHQRIRLVSTMFTRGGIHAECEIPGIVLQARKDHPGVDIDYAWPFDADFIAEFLAEQLRRTQSHATSANEGPSHGRM